MRKQRTLHVIDDRSNNEEIKYLAYDMREAIELFVQDKENNAGMDIRNTGNLILSGADIGYAALRDPIGTDCYRVKYMGVWIRGYNEGIEELHDRGVKPCDHSERYAEVQMANRYKKHTFKKPKH